jgi:hypothetical protein
VSNSKRGGPRDGAGAPIKDPGGEKTKRKNISILPSLEAKAERIGGGNASEGIRLALEAYELMTEAQNEQL